MEASHSCCIDVIVFRMRSDEAGITELRGHNIQFEKIRIATAQFQHSRITGGITGTQRITGISHSRNKYRVPPIPAQNYGDTIPNSKNKYRVPPIKTGDNRFKREHPSLEFGLTVFCFCSRFFPFSQWDRRHFEHLSGEQEPLPKTCPGKSRTMAAGAMRPCR